MMIEMIIDFGNITPAYSEHFKGGDGTAVIRKFEDESNKIMLFRLPAGTSVGVHRHEGNSEIIYILEEKIGNEEITYTNKDSVV